ncbi:MAG: hypothetical protein V4714_08295 [Bacteroidota bacterium]
MKKLLLISLLLFAFCPPGSGQSRLGLHTTQAELDIWRTRALSGPYKNNNDVQTNSPGDWARILANANAYKNNTSYVVSGVTKYTRTEDQFQYFTGTGKYPLGQTIYEPHTAGTKLKDAAFVAMVKEDASYITAAKAQILAYARDTKLDFSDRTRWPIDYFYDNNPGFAISEWLVRVINAYDYIRIAGGFTSPEQVEFLAWISKAGTFYSLNIDSYFNKRFVDRPNGNYTLTGYSTYAEADIKNKKYATYVGGAVVGFLGQGYNNRMLTQARFLTIAGVLTNNDLFQNNAKRVFREWLMFGVYPTGEIADMSRGMYKSGENEKGYYYAISMAAVAGEMADIFARKGDFSLYTYSTEAGYYGSASPGNPKTLLQVIQNTQKYMNGTFTRYSYGGAPNVIDGYDPANISNRPDIVYDTWFAQPNRYYQNATIKANYLRTASGTRAYPVYPNTHGSNETWGGATDVFPGQLFMFGQMEGEESPYPVDKLNQTLTVSSPPAQVWGNAPFAFTATASSGLAPTIVVSGPGTYASSFVTITGAGTITIVVTQAGNGSYNAAPLVTRTIVVAKAQPTISFAAIPDKNISDPPVSISATSSAGLTVVSVSNNSVLSATGTPGVFTINSTGLASITASTAATSNFLAASSTRTFNVVNTPVDGIVDVLDGAVSWDFSNTTITVNDTTRYSLFQRITNLAGSFDPYRYVESFTEAPREFSVYFLVGGTWIQKINLDENQLIHIDMTFSPPSGATQMKETAVGFNIELKEDPNDGHLYSQ